MTAAETELVAAPRVVRHLPQERPPPSRRRLGTIAASLVIVGGSAGMAAAASGALPGDALYPIKRGVEQAGTAVRFSDASKGEALLEQAAARLDEVRALQAQGLARCRADLDHRRRLPDRRRSGLGEAVRGLPGRWRHQEHHHGSRLHRGADGHASPTCPAPRPATDELLLDAADTLADIDQQARALCVACGPARSLAPPAALSAGAGAATVDNLLARPVAQAQLDIDAAEAARIARLKNAAEKSAGELPPPSTGVPGGTGQSPSIATAGDPLTSTLTPDGTLLPSTGGGTAVKDLVSGVTGSVVIPPITQPDSAPWWTTSPAPSTTSRSLLPDDGCASTDRRRRRASATDADPDAASLHSRSLTS